MVISNASQGFAYDISCSSMKIKLNCKHLHFWIKHVNSNITWSNFLFNTHLKKIAYIFRIEKGQSEDKEHSAEHIYIAPVKGPSEIFPTTNATTTISMEGNSPPYNSVLNWKLLSDFANVCCSFSYFSKILTNYLI